MSKPAMTATGDGYRFQWQTEAVQMEVEGIHLARGNELRALLTIATTANGERQLLHQADFNLSGSRARQDVERSLVKRGESSGGLNLDWAGFLEQLCFLTRDAWRNGNAPVYLPDLPARTGPRFLLEPFLEHAGPTVLFAMGGAGKSLFALALAASLASGQDFLSGQPLAQARTVAYLDWETDADTHRERLAALCAGVGLPLAAAPVYYFRPYASLAEAAPTLRRQFLALGIGAVVVDSLGYAKGGEPESADSAIRLFSALRTFAVPPLCIDHMTKNGGGDQATPYGSVYTHNAARMTWALEAADVPDGEQVITLQNRKRNNGKLLGRRTYAVVTEETDDQLTSVRYDARRPEDVPSLFPKARLADQLAKVMRDRRGGKWLVVGQKHGENGPEMGLQDLLVAENVTAQASAIIQALKAGERHEVFVNLGGYPTRWGLRANGQ